MNITWQAMNALSGHVASFAWQVFWQSSVLILALLCLDLLLSRRVRPSVRYALWLLVLLKLLIPPSFAIPSGIAWWIRPLTHQTISVALPSPSVEVRYLSGDKPGLRLANHGETTTSPGRCSPTSMALAGSLSISAALVAWVLYRQRQVNAMLRRATQAPGHLQNLLVESRNSLNVHRRIRLLVTSEPVSPALCGLFRPSILIPESLLAQLSQQQVRWVLLHELAHLKRGDVWTSCIQSLLQVFYWWHPLLWLANARIRRVREEAVDDAVMFALSDESSAYPPTLLQVARLALRRPMAVLGFVGILESRSMLKQRIQRLLNVGTPRKTGLTSACVVFIVAFGAVALPMGPASEREPGAPQPEPAGASDIATATNSVIVKYGNGVLTADTVSVDLAAGTVTAKGRVRIESAQNDSRALGFDWYLGDMLMGKNVVGSAEGDQPQVSPEPLYTRTFRVDPNTFQENLQHIMGSANNGTNGMQDLRRKLLNFIRSIGVDLQPPKSIYYKDREGALLVRATRSDLDTIEAGVQQLNIRPAQIHASIKAAQFTPSQAAEFWAGIVLQQPTNKLAFLNGQDAAMQLDRLKALAAPDQLSQASITTLSGRQAQIQIGGTVSIVTNAMSTGSPAGTVQTNQVPIGLTIDFFPYAGDGQTVQMTISGSFTEFLGYDDPGQFVPQATDTGVTSHPLAAALPLPHFRVRHLRTTAAVALDRQTVVLGGSEEFETDRVPVFGGDLPKLGRLFRRPEQPGELILFITATLVDPAGNPVHEQSR